jgi:malonyl-CoA O-methyltransferase
MMELEQRAMLELLPDLAGKAVLDLACGSGRYLATLIERGASRVVGLDISPRMLARAKTNPCYLVQADLRWLPLVNSSFEVVVCGLAVGHVGDLCAVMAEVGRVLVSGGIVVYSDFHPLGSLAGWKRTFRAQDGRQYSVRHHTHLYADHHAACRAAGLVIEEVREPLIDFKHKWRGCPAVMVIRARKT